MPAYAAAAAGCRWGRTRGAAAAAASASAAAAAAAAAAVAVAVAVATPVAASTAAATSTTPSGRGTTLPSTVAPGGASLLYSSSNPRPPLPSPSCRFVSTILRLLSAWDGGPGLPAPARLFFPASRQGQEERSHAEFHPGQIAAVRQRPPSSSHGRHRTAYNPHIFC